MSKKDVTQAAKDIRRLLKETYPGIKFRVRSERFSGGSAVNIFWTDGPTEVEVSKLTNHCKGWDNGYYTEYIMPSREVSVATMTAAAAAVAAHYGIPTPEIHTSDGRHPYLTDYTPVQPPHCLKFQSYNGRERLCDVVHRAAHMTGLHERDAAEAFAEVFPPSEPRANGSYTFAGMTVPI